MKFLLLLIIIFVLHSCNSSIKKGEIVIQESNEEPYENRAVDTDTVYLRLRDGFENDSIKVCYEECISHYKITTDKSIGFARSIAVIASKRNANKITIKLNGTYFIVPINNGYIYIDISNENNNLLKIRYSNKILTLS